MALFITFEGGEGCGKSLQARALYRKLSRLAIPSLLTYEPGGTAFGRRIARWLKWSQDTEISSLTELLLFNASRSQLIAEVIQPSLKEGKNIICDRYTDSTTAYQSYGRGLNPEMVEAINHTATGGLKPDLTFLLDMAPETSLTRISASRPDRFERENIAFHKRVRAGYLKLAANEPERWFTIDANQSKEKIARIIWQRVTELLSISGD